MLWAKFMVVVALVPSILAFPGIHRRRVGDGVVPKQAHSHSHIRRAAGSSTYNVVSGDTGNAIAAAYSITFTTLSNSNPNVNWNNLQIGQGIVMPSARTPISYTVASGDTGTLIANKYDIYMTDLGNANPNVNWNNLQIGSILRVPRYGSWTTYTIVSGDTGYAIAAAEGISFSSLSSANPTVNWNNLQIGQVLSVPASVSPTSSTLPSPAPSPTSTTSAVKTSTAATAVTTKSTTSSSSSTSSKPASSSTKTSTPVSSSSTSTANTSSTKSSVSTTSTANISTTKSTAPATSTANTSTTKSSVSTTSTANISSTKSSASTTSTAAVTPATTQTATVNSPNAVQTINNNDGIASRADTYTFYQGDGSTAAGWPPKSQWLSFSTLWTNILPYIGQSCAASFNVANNSPAETQDMYNAIQSIAQKSLLDHRLILAVIIQESSGCVRAPTTSSPGSAITNPGLMQDFNGVGSCNFRNGTVLNPCPTSNINQMVFDGVMGTTSSSVALAGGLVQDINANAAYSDGQAIYRAARVYNSGSVPGSGDLGAAGATRCYCSDVANRLMGWISARKTCTLDG